MKVRLTVLAAAVFVCGVFATEGSAQKIPDPGGETELRAKVWRCPGFVVFRGKSSVSGRLIYRARNVRRSPHVRCAKVRKLLKATYSQGPLKPIRTQFIGNSGRPVLWFRGGWRCSNGAGGALCRNVRRRGLNAINLGYGSPRQAIVAQVR